MFYKSVFAAAFLSFLLFMPAAQAGHDGLVTKTSDYGVQETIDRLEKVFKKKGVTVFAKINHGAGAKKIGAKLSPTQIIIFGTPKIGTPLMQSNQKIGIDLPLKVLAWKDKNGKVMIAYNDPKYLAKRHHIKDRDNVFGKMGGAVNNLTNAAIKKPKNGDKG